MAAIIKTPEQIEKMRVAGRLAAEVLEMIAPHVKAGISTGELDRICHDYIVNVQQAIPAPLNYHGFPKSICTSVNHVICHGIPADDKLLKDGDIINIARITQAKIIAISYSCSRFYVFKSWDQFKLPLPFSKICFYFDQDLILVERDIDQEKIVELEKKLLDKLNNAQSQADKSFV